MPKSQTRKKGKNRDARGKQIMRGVAMAAVAYGAKILYDEARRMQLEHRTKMAKAHAR